MSKTTTSKSKKSAPTSKSAARLKGAIRADHAATKSDDARAEALARLNATPDPASKRKSKPSRGAKPENWQDDPLESDAALEAAIAKMDGGDAPTPPATASPTRSPKTPRAAKGARGGNKATAAKGSPTGGSGGRGGRGAKSGKGGKPPAKPKRLSALDAASKVLAESDRPLRALDMIEVMHAQGLWSSPGGKTPEATLYAAITREIAAKGTDARFQKVDRGMFTSAMKSTSGKGA